MGSAGVLASGRWGDVGEDEFTAETPRRRVFWGDVRGLELALLTCLGRRGSGGNLPWLGGAVGPSMLPVDTRFWGVAGYSVSAGFSIRKSG